MTVINLGQYRDLLREWEELRGIIIKARSRGGTVCLTDEDGNESIHLLGTHRQDPQAAMDAAMRLVIELNRSQDAPGLLANTS